MKIAFPKTAAAKRPSEALEERVTRTVHDRLSGLPETIVEAILTKRLFTLDERAADAKERGHEDEIDALVVALDGDLLRAVQYERAHGVLKPWSAAGGIEKNRGACAQWHYEPRLVEFLQSQLKPGEKIISVGPRSVATSLRTFTRSELKAGCRFATERSNSKFEQQFLSDHHIDQLVAAEAARANPPSPYADADRSAGDRA